MVKNKFRFSDGICKAVAANVILQWIFLFATLLMADNLALLFQAFAAGGYGGGFLDAMILKAGGVSAACVAVRLLCGKFGAEIFRKADRNAIGAGDSATCTIGADDATPQFVCALAWALTLFALTLFVNVRCAIAIFVCVPFVPILVAAGKAVFTERLAQSRSWTALPSGADCLEFAECCGIAVGIVAALLELGMRRISLWGALFVIFVAADFFVPKRGGAGSLFGVAMRGVVERHGWSFAEGKEAPQVQ